MRFPIPHRRQPSLTALFVLLVAGSLLTAGAAAAQSRAKGFVPPDDWERILEEKRRVFPVNKDPLPESWDWRTMGGVTPTKNQGDCGSCWAFGAAGEMEAKIKIYYGVELDLSEQQIISCNPYGNGCGGGWAGIAYYVFQHYGGVTENCMPYEGSDFVPCTQDDYHKFTTLDSWYSVANDVDQIKMALLEGPVCTSIDANTAFEEYTSGCLDAPGGWTNHLVLIVGWNDRACNDQGAWIIKNSWGPSWGESGFGYVKYGACSIGSGVTALRYTPPPVDVTVSGPDPSVTYYGDEPVTITWLTQNEPVDNVDIWYGTGGWCQDIPVAENVPNTGSFDWVLPNITSERATFLIFPSEGTDRGYGFIYDELTVVGHQTRYVSAAGSNTFPYDSPSTAAHTIAAAVLAGAGRDSVLVAGGDYLESVTVNSQCTIVGGYSPDFGLRDPVSYPTRLRGVNGCLRFGSEAGELCGVSGVTFHDCVAAIGTVPENGRHGAAIISLGASPTIADCRFENNRANPSSASGWGGAILCHEGSPRILDSVFADNVGSRGAAVALSQTDGALVEGCVFTGNACSDSTSEMYSGGALHVEGGSATLRGLTIDGNGGTGRGGGLAVAGGAQVTLADVDLTGNRAWLGGGGVHVASGAVTAVRGRWSHNAAATGHGGGLQAMSGDVSLRNLELVGNEAGAMGGAVLALGVTTVDVEHCVVADNLAGQSVGGLMLVAAAASVVRHNVVTGNEGGGLMASGAELVSDFNLAWQNPGGDFLGTVGAHDRVADPHFSDAAGGDYAPGLHSPSVDSGDPDPACHDADGSVADRGHCGGPDGLSEAPAPVTGAAVTDLGGGTYRVSWTASAAVDIAQYAVYRDSSEVFLPGTDNLVALVAAPDVSCEDTPPHDGYYVVAALDADGHMGGFSARVPMVGGPVAVGPELPAALGITGVVPNPFNPRTVVRFDLPRPGHARLDVYDLRGRLVSRLHDGVLAAGRHEVAWDGTDTGGRAAAAGIYFVRLDDGREVATVKAVLAK